MSTRRRGRPGRRPSRLGPWAGSLLVAASLVWSLTLAAISLPTPTPAYAAFAGSNGLIALSSNQGGAGDFEILSMNPDGSGQTNLTNNPADDTAPSWSADGTKIVFVRDIGGGSQIFVMNANGSGQTNLTNGPAGVLNGQPHFSTDSTKIVFASDRAAGNQDIWVMDANGATPTRLTTDPGFDDQPAWSPDGTRIAFSRDGANVFVMNADGTGQTNLTGGVGTINAQPNWSPDGTRIAFSSDRAGTLDIFVMNANGSAPTQVTTDPASDDQPAWSPDGTRIAFTSDRAGTLDILTVNPDGTGTTNLTSAGAAVDVEPNWQPLPPDLAITITDAPDPAGVGQPITYTVTVRNVSSASAPAVIVTNTLPAGVTFTSATPSQGSCGAVANGVFTCALGSLGANAQATISVVVVPNSAGTLTYSASVAASAADRNTADNAATASTTVTASPAAPPVPPAAPGAPGTADVSLTKTGPANATQGSNPVYTLVIRNNGPAAADNVTVNDTTPTGLTFISNTGDCVTVFPCALGSIPAGQTRVITTTYNLPYGYAGPDPIRNVATVTTTTSDLNASNNTGQVTTTPQGQVYDPNNDDHDKDDEKPKETEQQRHERNRTNASSPDDERIEGNVISTNCGDAWPYLTIANRDGEVEVRLVKDAKKYCDNIQVGDYFDATGQKIHELLFYAEDFTLHRGGRKVQ